MLTSPQICRTLSEPDLANDTLDTTFDSLDCDHEMLQNRNFHSTSPGSPPCNSSKSSSSLTTYPLVADSQDISFDYLPKYLTHFTHTIAPRSHFNSFPLPRNPYKVSQPQISFHPQFKNHHLVVSLSSLKLICLFV